MVREQPSRNTASLDEPAAGPPKVSVHHGNQEGPPSWLHPVRRSRWKQQQALHRILDVRRVDLEEYERAMLIPHMYDRVLYMRQMFERIRDIAASPETAHRIGPQLRELAPDDATGADGDSVASYLTEVVRQTEETFITPLKLIEREHRSVTSLSQLYRFFNDVRYICGIVVAHDKILFRYKAKHTLTLVETDTGKRIRDDQKAWSIVLTPFELTLDELKRVAESTEWSIDNWSKRQEEARKPFLEYVAATNNARASGRQIYIQLLAIALSVSLSAFFLTARDPFALQKENRALRADLNEARAEAARLAAEADRLRTQLRPGQPPTTPAP